MRGPLEIGLCSLAWVPEGPPREQKSLFKSAQAGLVIVKEESCSPAGQVWPSEVFYVSPSVLKNMGGGLADI